MNDRETKSCEAVHSLSELSDSVVICWGDYWVQAEPEALASASEAEPSEPLEEEWSAVTPDWLPSRRPSSASLICRLRIAYTHDCTNDSYFISASKDRQYWILWYDAAENGETEFQGPVAFMPRAGLDRDSAARVLLRQTWSYLAESFQVEQFHKVGNVCEGGLITCEEAEALTTEIRSFYDLQETLNDAEYFIASLRAQDERLLAFGQAVYRELGKGPVRAPNPFGKHRYEPVPDYESLADRLRVLDRADLADEITELSQSVRKHLDFYEEVHDTLNSGGAIAFEFPAKKQ